MLSEPWPFKCCANRPPASDRISGSCGDQEDEREAPEKEAGQSQWIICTEYSVQILQVCIGVSLMVLNLSGSLQFWWIPLDYPLRLRRRWQRRWRRRWSLHDTKGHCPRRWRGKNCSMIYLFAKRYSLYNRKDTKISLQAKYKIQLSSPIFPLDWD